jgi:uncharacterized protein YciI
MVPDMKSCAVWLLGLASSCAAGPGGPAAATAPVPPSIAARPGDIAITDVSVVPMTSDGVLAHHTVVIRGDRIVAVAPDARVALAAGATVIAGTGRWLMPGLADMHVHTWRDEDLTMFLAAGVTTIRNMWGTEQHLAWRSQIARGERLGPTIVTAGPLIDGDPPDWPGSVVLQRAEDADAIVAAQQAAGYDFLAGMRPGSHRELTALEIGYSQAIGIAPVRYQIERKPDADGQRRFSVTAARSGTSVTSELVVDDGGVARRTAGSEVTTRVPGARR